MGCLILILILAGILTLPSIFGPLIFWSLAAIIYYQSENNKRQSQQLGGQAKQLREQAQQHRELLKAVNPQAYQELVQREATEAAKAEEERRAANKRKLYASLAIGAAIIFFWIVGSTSKHSTSTPTATPEPTAVVTSTVPSWATPIPEPSAAATSTEVRKAIAVIASPTPAPSIQIPNPTEEQATAAFNDLQDQFHRPHVKSVSYIAATDSYHWIGPKTGKKMSMKHSQFIAEIWNGYYKKINGTESSPTTGPSAAAQEGKTIRLFLNAPLKAWSEYYGHPTESKMGGSASMEWMIADRLTLDLLWQDNKPKRIDITNVEGKATLTQDEANEIMSSVGFKQSWSRNANDETHWGDPTLGIWASYDEDDGLSVWIENFVMSLGENSPEVVEQKAKQLASLMHWSDDPDSKEAGIQDGMRYADLLDMLNRTKHLYGFGPKIEQAVMDYCPRFRGKPDSDERADYGLAFAVAVNDEGEQKGLLKSDGSFYKPVR
jgi:hypothetical protein